jgi:toxin ParE1/3/4
VKPKWTVQLSDAANIDFHGIVNWTASEFGAAQALRYEVVLTDAIDALTAGPAAGGAKARPDLLPGLFLLHVARGRHKGRHVVLYRVKNETDRIIEVLRLLHDSMDFARHLPEAESDEP